MEINNKPKPLQTKLGKIPLANPIIVASGTFSYRYNEIFDNYNVEQLGAIVTKTITPLARVGNPPPRLYETKAGLLNSIGLQNPGIESYIQKQLPKYENFSNPLIVSISASKISEFAEMIERLETCPRINGYEVNVSCPNVENEGLAFGTDPAVVYELTALLAKTTPKELIIKLSPNVTDIAVIAKAAEDGGATCVSLINTLQGMAIDYKTGQSFIKRGIAGYSGVAVKPVALACVYKVFQAVKLPIIGMGGVSCFEDVIEFIYAGASAVAVGTGQFAQPTLPLQIIDDLDAFLRQKKVSVSDLIGKVKFN